MKKKDVLFFATRRELTCLLSERADWTAQLSRFRAQIGKPGAIGFWNAPLALWPKQSALLIRRMELMQQLGLRGPGKDQLSCPRATSTPVLE